MGETEEEGTRPLTAGVGLHNMKKEYIKPSVRTRDIHLSSIMAESIPFRGGTDDNSPKESKPFIDCIVFDNEE